MVLGSNGPFGVRLKSHCYNQLTEPNFFSSIWWQQEYEQSQRRYESAGDDQVEAVVEITSTYVHGVGDVYVWLRTAGI